MSSNKQSLTELLHQMENTPIHVEQHTVARCYNLLHAQVLVSLLIDFLEGLHWIPVIEISWSFDWHNSLPRHYISSQLTIYPADHRSSIITKLASTYEKYENEADFIIKYIDISVIWRPNSINSSKVIQLKKITSPLHLVRLNKNSTKWSKNIKIPLNKQVKSYFAVSREGICLLTTTPGIDRTFTWKNSYIIPIYSA